MRPNYNILDEEPLPEMDVDNALVDLLVNDEEFNSAVDRLSEDAKYITSQLSSLEDNSPAREKFEDFLAGRLSQEIPGLESSADFQSITQSISELANQGMALNEALAEAIAAAMSDLKRMAGHTGVLAGTLFASGMLDLPFVFVALGAVGYRTVKAHRQEDDNESLVGSVKQLNSLIDQVVQSAQILSVVRDDFQVMWNHELDEDQEQPAEI